MSVLYFAIGTLLVVIIYTIIIIYNASYPFVPQLGPGLQLIGKQQNLSPEDEAKKQRMIARVRRNP